MAQQVKRFFKGLGAAVLLLLIVIAGPILYTETMCRGETLEQAEAKYILDPEWQRAEARTYLTYPEWHIVYAYEGYAEVLSHADPHNFPYLQAITGFWSSLCALTEKADELGPAGTDAKLTIYTIGASFTLEMAFKALYEETLGRLASLTSETTPQDKVEAEMAADYATFLQEVPWYKYDFDLWHAKLMAAPIKGLRSYERRIALGLEWKAKSAYARVIAQAAGAVGADELRMRIAVADFPAERAVQVDGWQVIDTGEPTIIEVPRYRSFTTAVIRQVLDGTPLKLIEIAGNDDILISVLHDRNSELPELNVLSTTARVGFADELRSLLALKVHELDEALPMIPARIEHIYDY